MDEVLEVLDRIRTGVIIFGGMLVGALAMWSVIQEKRLDRTGLFGIVFMVVGLLYLLHLLDLVREQWLLLIGSMLNGVLGLMVATDMLPFWRIADISEKRWMFLWGVFWTLFAVVYAVILDLP